MKNSIEWLLEIDQHLNEACATEENLTVDLDSPFGATYDVNHVTKAMNTVQNYVWTPTDGPLYFNKDDVLRFAWA